MNLQNNKITNSPDLNQINLMALNSNDPENKDVTKLYLEADSNYVYNDVFIFKNVKAIDYENYEIKVASGYDANEVAKDMENNFKTYYVDENTKLPFSITVNGDMIKINYQCLVGIPLNVVSILLFIAYANIDNSGEKYVNYSKNNQISAISQIVLSENFAKTKSIIIILTAEETLFLKLFNYCNFNHPELSDKINYGIYFDGNHFPLSSIELLLFDCPNYMYSYVREKVSVGKKLDFYLMFPLTLINRYEAKIQLSYTEVEVDGVKKRKEVRNIGYDDISDRFFHYGTNDIDMDEFVQGLVTIYGSDFINVDSYTKVTDLYTGTIKALEDQIKSSNTIENHVFYKYLKNIEIRFLMEKALVDNYIKKTGNNDITKEREISDKLKLYLEKVGDDNLYKLVNKNSSVINEVLHGTSVNILESLFAPSSYLSYLLEELLKYVEQ